jgi:DNA-binding CsgD family transcriptional regulator/Flp pilus assembly protein TadD
MKWFLIICLNFILLYTILATEADSLQLILKNSASPYQKVFVLLKISDVYEFSDISLSRKYVLDALTLAQSKGKNGKNYSFRRMEGISHYYLGILEKHTANYQASLAGYEKALAIFDELALSFPDSIKKTKVDKANVLNAIGNLQLLNQNYDKALSFFKSVLTLYEEENDTIRIAGTRMSMGVVYEQTNQLNEALKQYTLSLNLYQLKKHQRFIAVCLNNMGNIYKQQGKFALADSAYLVSLQTRRQTNDIKGVSIVLNNLSELRLITGNYLEAIFFGEESLERSHEVGNLSTMRYTYGNISKAQAKLGNYAEAYQNQLVLRQINDSILGIEKQKALLEFQQKYESVLKEKENVLLKDNLLRRKYSITILLGALISVISISVLLLLISRSRNISLKQKQALQQKEQQLSEMELLQHKELSELKSKELSSLTLQMINKNEALNNLKNKLQEIQNSGNVTNLNPILNSIESNFQLNDEWQRFKLHFEAVNNHFFDKLNNSYPDLTSYEIKLCVYLKIGLTTKEISQMLNTSIDAVNKARQRLRKKINMDSTTDLAVHFQSF